MDDDDCQFVVTEPVAAIVNQRVRQQARPLRTMGITDTKDLHETQRGVRPGPVPDTIWLDGPGALPQDFRKLPYTRVRRPIWPLDAAELAFDDAIGIG